MLFRKMLFRKTTNLLLLVLLSLADLDCILSSELVDKRDLRRYYKRQTSPKVCKKKAKERRYQVPADDLMIRFSKVYFEKTIPSVFGLPLQPKDYPPSRALAAWLRKSLCISVVIEEDCCECDIDVRRLINSVGGGYPLHPSNNTNSSYWDEFREVIQVQKKRLDNVHPSKVMPLPQIWKDKESLDEIAECVHDELPGTHHHDLIRQFVREGFEVDYRVLPSYSCTEFLRREVMLSFVSTWAIQKVAPYNFATKYYVGRARPEEVAWAVAQGTINAPTDIEEDIKTLKLESKENFTAYPEGSPRHPSWPAMHSAGSASSLWLPVILNLTEDQICQTKLVDWAVSYGRTVAGVHFAHDNIAGLQLGQEIIARKLPEMLSETYGSRKKAVQAKIESMRFEWKDFKTSTCYTKHSQNKTVMDVNQEKLIGN